MPEQGTLVAPRLWAEDGIERANMYQREKPIGLSPTWIPKMLRTAKHSDKKVETPQNKKKKSKPHNQLLYWKRFEERQRVESQVATAVPRESSTLR